MEFRNSSNYHEINAKYSIETGESYIDEDGNQLPTETVPDQSISIKDMILRQRRGQWVPRLDAQYDDDLAEFAKNAPDLTKLTKLELLDYGKEVNEFIKSTRNVIAEYNKRKKEENINSGPQEVVPPKEV